VGYLHVQADSNVNPGMKQEVEAFNVSNFYTDGSGTLSLNDCIYLAVELAKAFLQGCG